MEEPRPNLPPQTADEPSTGAAPGSTEPDAGNSSRRDFLNGSARKLAYVAPLALLFHPTRACASNGSTLTYWDSSEGTIKHRT